MPKASTLRLSLILGLILTAVSVPATSGYAGEIAHSVTVSGPTGSLMCQQTYELQATVVDNLGKKISEQPVVWTIFSFPVGATDTLSPPTSNTDVNGVARTSITFGAVSGTRFVRATADSAFGQIVLNVINCAVTTLLNRGVCSSALGLRPPTGYSLATKIQSLGRYITFKLSFGPLYAGKLVVVTHATRALPPALPNWSVFFGATARIANQNGDVFYWVRSYVAAWWSVRGSVAASAGVPAAVTNSCQGRWRA